MFKSKRKQKGFTLAELLLIIVAIIAIWLRFQFRFLQHSWRRQKVY